MDEKELTLEKLKLEAEKYESPKRYRHTLSVFDECLYFAKSLGFDEYECFTVLCAALLHDITKDFPYERQKEIGVIHGMNFSDSPTLHQDTGALFAEDNYSALLGPFAEGVVSAVSKHTTGGEMMNRCDMVLFLADYTEPLRKYGSCIKIREYIHSECEKINKKDKASVNSLLARTVLMICRQTIDHLSENGMAIDKRTAATENAMQALLKE